MKNYVNTELEKTDEFKNLKAVKGNRIYPEDTPQQQLPTPTTPMT